MSVRFLNPHNVSHGETDIARCREAGIRSRCSEVEHLFGDGAVHPERAAGFKPVSEITIVTEDVLAALSIAPGTCASLTFDVVDAEGGSDKTVTAAHAVYLGPVEEMGEAKSGPGVATMRFVCRSSDGSAHPITVT